MEVMQTSPSLAQNWDQAQLMYLEGTPTSEIARMFGIKRGTLDARFSRAHLPAIRERQRQEGRGDRTRQKIAAAAENIVDQLTVKTPKSAEGLNRHADTLGKVAKAAALVHGWGESETVPVVVAGLMVGFPEPDDEPEEQEPIDVDSGSVLAAGGPNSPESQ